MLLLVRFCRANKTAACGASSNFSSAGRKHVKSTSHNFTCSISTRRKHPVSRAPSEGRAPCGIFMRCTSRESNPWLTAGCLNQGLQSLVWLRLTPALKTRKKAAWPDDKTHWSTLQLSLRLPPSSLSKRAYKARTYQIKEKDIKKEWREKKLYKCIMANTSCSTRV